MRAAILGQEVDREHLVELLAPFFAAQFSSDEIEAMIRFYDGDEGRQLTGLLIDALNWNSPTVPQLNQATTEKLTAYLQSPVSLKLTGLASQFSEEAKGQVGPYLCTLFEPRGFSCAALTQLAGTGAIVGLLGTYFKNSQSSEKSYQHDADIVRARHLLEWARIIEAYYKKAGRYPLQHRVKSDEILRVQIATREQQAFLDPASPNYARSMDFNDPRFTSVSVKELVADIEGQLGREIDERYDPQRPPNGAPIYLSYFATKNGYLIWTVCRTCRSRSNGFTHPLSTGIQTINIGSSWFIDNVAKTQSVESLQANKEFVEFIGNGPTRAGWFDQLERAQVHESKN